MSLVVSLHGQSFECAVDTDNSKGDVSRRSFERVVDTANSKGSVSG